MYYFTKIQIRDRGRSAGSNRYCVEYKKSRNRWWYHFSAFRLKKDALAEATWLATRHGLERNIGGYWS